MISTSGLARKFGEFWAVQNLNLEVQGGGICAFLGPNGAGKSTTVKMLTGTLAPSAGAATVAGIDVAKEPQTLRRSIGVLPEDLGLFDSLTIEEHLSMSGPIYGLSRAETRERADQLLRTLALDNRRDTFLGQCSYGMRKKTALALALLHNPKVLFLDEPFEGIDPVTSRTILNLLLRLASTGVTIFLTSHILELVERLATQVVVIQHGRIVWNTAVIDLPKPLEELYLELVGAPDEEELAWLGLPPS
ncbi:MAG TPA: multidrug ABC transporter ATP-binding protein [Solibacterales bacterium]|nr:multidrug ABC transporter ATP-binding protein [Bryobacterales bacterium]